MAEAIRKMKKSFDKQQVVSHLTQYFNECCQTEMPPSKVIMFQDVYLDEKYKISAPSRDNNCYTAVNYKLNICKEDELSYLTFKDHAQKLQDFIESFYFQNDGYFEWKLTLMKLASKQIPIDKVIFEVGKGGDGKQMEATLDASALGKGNCCTLECSIFTDRSEFRRSAHFAEDKLMVRI